MGSKKKFGYKDIVIQKYLRALKLSIFVVQKTAAPNNGIEFGQRSIGDINRSLATSYDV